MVSSDARKNNYYKICKLDFADPGAYTIHFVQLIDQSLEKEWVTAKMQEMKSLNRAKREKRTQKRGAAEIQHGLFPEELETIDIETKNVGFAADGFSNET